MYLVTAGSAVSIEIFSITLRAKAKISGRSDRTCHDSSSGMNILTDVSFHRLLNQSIASWWQEWSIKRIEGVSID